MGQDIASKAQATFRYIAVRDNFRCMKTFALTISLLLLSILNTAAQDSLVYSLDSKISWDNFQAEPLEQDSAGARISITIQMQIDKVNVWTGVTSFSAWAIMYPNRSWVEEEYKDEYSLNHEQLHFDIAQLIAKRLETHINNQKINGGNKQKMNKVFNDFYLELNELQDLYDKETLGGNDPKKQAEWDSKVRQDLATYLDE